MRRTLPALPLVAALAMLAPLLLVPDVPSEPHAGGEASRVRLVADRTDEPARRAPGSDPRTWQTSDRVVGPSAPPASSPGEPGLRRKAAVRRQRVLFDYRVAPGVRATSIQQRTRRGVVRYSVVTAKWSRKSVGVTLMQPPTVATTRRTGALTRRTPHGVVGVNGDFFDIGDTGAPLGVGVRRAQVRHGRSHGWNAAFYLDAAGRPRIGTVPVTARIRERPDLTVTNVNSAQVMPDGLGVYTAAWGPTSGLRWTDGQRRHVAMLQIEDGRVVRKADSFPAGRPLEGRILVARGRSQAAALRAIKVGEPLTLRWSVEGRPRTVITGNQVVLQRGRVVATDDVELHPRTAVGIDPRRKRIVLLVVDGRQEFSDGFTMVQVAKKLRALGARSGLNLDGGGSTTLIAHRNGRLRVLNSPSDGAQRKVPNGLAITSRIAPRS